MRVVRCEQLTHSAARVKACTSPAPALLWFHRRGEEADGPSTPLGLQRGKEAEGGTCNAAGKKGHALIPTTSLPAPAIQQDAMAHMAESDDSTKTAGRQCTGDIGYLCVVWSSALWARWCGAVRGAAWGGGRRRA